MRTEWKLPRNKKIMFKKFKRRRRKTTQKRFKNAILPERDLFYSFASAEMNSKHYDFVPTEKYSKHQEKKESECGKSNEWMQPMVQEGNAVKTRNGEQNQKTVKTMFYSRVYETL